MSPQAFLYSKLVQYGPGWFMLVEAGECPETLVVVGKKLPKRRLPTIIFRCYVSFREGILGKILQNVETKLLPGNLESERMSYFFIVQGLGLKIM